MNAVKSGDAELEDAKRILEIYAYYVKNTAVSIEYDVAALSKFQLRMKNIKIPLSCILPLGSAVLAHDLDGKMIG